MAKTDDILRELPALERDAIYRLIRASVVNDVINIIPEMGYTSPIRYVIEHGHVINLKIDNLKTNALPDIIENFSLLQSLFIVSPIRSLPESIGNLSQLRVLVLYNTHLKNLPASVKNLKNLEELVIQISWLDHLAEFIGQLNHLQKIQLIDLPLEKLPSSIGNCKNLEKIYCSELNLHILPPEIGKLDKLRELTIKNSHLKIIPDEIGNLKNLMKLSIFNNELEEIPATIGDILSLKCLWMHHNQLHVLPKTLLALQEISSFSIENNPLDLLSPELQSWLAEKHRWKPEHAGIAETASQYKPDRDKKGSLPRLWLDYNGEKYYCVAWAPKGNLIVTQCGDGQFRIHEAREGKTITKYHSPPIDAVSFAADGRRVITAGGGNDASAMDIWSGDVLFKFGDHDERVSGVAWAPTGQLIASASLDGTVRVHDATSGTPVLVLHHGEPVLNLCWSPDGAKLLTKTRTGRLCTWDVATGTCLHAWNTGPAWDPANDVTDIPGGIAWSPDGRVVADAAMPAMKGEMKPPVFPKHDVILRDPGTWEEQLRFRVEGTVNHLAWSPDGRYVACGEYIRIHDACTGAFLLEAGQHYGGFSWSPDSKRIAVCHGRGYVLDVGDALEQQAMQQEGNAPDDEARLSRSVTMHLEEMLSIMKMGDKIDRLSLARDPHAPPGILDLLAGDASPDVRLEVAWHGQASPEDQDIMSADGDARVRRVVARHPGLPPGAMERLATDDDDRVREIVAHRLDVTASILAILAGDAEPRVRSAVALHPGITRELATILAKDHVQCIRMDVLANPATPADMLGPLGRAGDEYSRLVLARRRDPTPNLLDMLVQDECVDVRVTLARNPTTPVPVLVKMAGDPHLLVRRAVAWNPATPGGVLDMLAGDADAIVKRAAVEARGVRERYRGT